MVRRGDTLYAIAWQYGWDYKSLARKNGIRAPYTIHPGQRIRLDKTAARPQSGSGASTSGKTKTETSGNVPGRVIGKPARATTGAGNTATASSAKQASRQQSTSASKENPDKPAPLRWQWPIDAAVSLPFGKDNKGLDFNTAAATKIVATARGRVVYAGAGIRGYGQLIIVKHSETYLSAYSHFGRLRTSEGETVKAGSLLAETGNSSAGNPSLHFEIRRNGRPVNPAGVLPRRAQ